MEDLEKGGQAVGRAVTRARDALHTVGTGGTLAALGAVLARVPVGVRALVWATSEHANGAFGVRKRGAGGADVVLVPGGAPVLLEVEATAVEWRVPDNSEIEARVPMPLAACLAIGYRAQAAGNAHYRRRAWKAALRDYNKGLFALALPVAAAAPEARALEGVLHCNSARVHLQQHDARHAERACRRALDLDVDSVRAHYLLARALLEAPGRAREACDELDKAALVDPDNSQVRALRRTAGRQAHDEMARSSWAGKLLSHP